MKQDIALSDYLLSEIRFGYFFKYISAMRLVMKRWYEIVPLLFNMGPVTIEFRNGRKIKAETLVDFFKYWSGIENEGELIKLQYGAKILILHNKVEFYYRKRKVRFYNPTTQDELLFLLKEQFFEEQYKSLECRGETVIDIGAAIGDSAIYFSLNGASRVYAFELYPYSYRLARRNIALNGLSRRIRLFNIGCDWKGSCTRINPAFISNGSSSLREFKSGKRIRVLTLEEIANRYASSGAVLKMDCEGSEYNIILNTKADTLRKFKRMMIEYHHGYRNICRRLKNAGFRVKHTTPKKLSHTDGNTFYLGMIFAERV